MPQPTILHLSLMMSSEGTRRERSVFLLRDLITNDQMFVFGCTNYNLPPYGLLSYDPFKQLMELRKAHVGVAKPHDNGAYRREPLPALDLHVVFLAALTSSANKHSTYLLIT